MKVQVWECGGMWAARRAGCPGQVFGTTEAEAISRVNQWTWEHLAKSERIRIKGSAR